ncbi:MAG: DEAD/DEAH box helicase family protein, partial [Verrucomicrobiae bacterium]|nr:DEAD/DEAH box helicase family protein [Verrucomicrobiae bacterium]
MSAPSFAPLHPAISLHVAGRISAEDAARQESTAQVILQRLSAQPGLVLADEVGMGKTFVALATALSVTLADRSRRPAVVMIPAALERKWPADFDVFKERCLPKDFRRDLRCASARTAVDFLKALDDPPQRRAAIVFVTHGAMHRSIGDVWVKLALLQRSIHRRRDAAPLRRALVRCLGGLLRMERRVQCADESFWSRLLITPPDQWSSPLKRAGLLEADADEPVPAAFVKALRRLDRNQLDPLYQTLRGIPMRASAGFEHRVKAARYSLNNVLPEIWGHCLAELRLRLPLLILDEAHHLKNARTRLAGLFENEESREASNEISRGTLRGVFERMIFLTATPFQLGHEELCSVLDRFDGIRWKSAAAPVMTQADFAERREELREKLTAAQLATQRLDTVWGRLRADDLSADGSTFNDSAAWWPAARAAPDTLTPAARYVVASFGAAETLMRTAEAALRPWVIRHLRPRLYKGSPRREKLTGAAIITDAAMPGDPGIEVGGSALVPFLLAARATLCAPDKRPVFAEGLASSFEAFLETRRLRGAGTDDDDEPPAAAGAPDQAGAWYLRQLAALLPEGPHTRSAAHPKVAATARRAVELWKQGEKVLIFCHYVVTGRVLRQLVSQLMHDEIVRIGSEKMNCPAAEVPAQIERLGRRFFDSDSPARRACDHAVGQILDSFPLLHEHRRDLLDLYRRYLRTPAFL